ncbi:5-formyltetrahydrofolate cyclo-ligase [Aeromicrobium sp. CTD01-1L150]|uniref:5-formyltetrahydrofolate cyclo-ligase n=1 Tax=Aeromicrobium sp. CTD01-1L150 TaxID=3341830 RepID=UPI0035C23A95
MTGRGGTATVEAKQALRRELLAARRAMAAPEREQVAEAVALHLLAERVVARARRVAAYRSMAIEPGTSPLLTQLHARGVEVLVPVVVGESLDWVRDDPAQPVERGVLGIEEPAGERLGVDALHAVDVIIAPALAVDHAGRRLGRGAGYYDRALAEAGAPVIAVVHSRELLPVVPSEPHDVPVPLVATESGIFRVP